MPIRTHIHSDDPWDVKTNMKIEEQENKRIMRNPDMTFRYNRFTTFAGYLYFGDMTPKQRRIYEEIKKQKRAKNFNLDEDVGVQDDFYQKLYKQLIQERLTREMVIEMCLMEGKKYSSVSTIINTMLKDRGISNRTMSSYLKDNKKDNHNKSTDGISELVPDI